MIIAGVAVSDSASDVERQAAATLKDLCQRMSGRDLPLLSADDDSSETDGTVLIGLPITNARIGALVRSRKIRNPKRSVKPEGFVIETLIDGGLSTLIITGRDPKGVLNGVHHLLQEVFGVEFNGETQHVPSHENLTVPELSIASG